MSEFSQQNLRQQQRHAASPLGRDPRQDRTTVGNMRADGLESDFLGMPVAPGPVLQNAAGEFFFWFGVSIFGGDDIMEGT